MKRQEGTGRYWRGWKGLDGAVGDSMGLGEAGGDKMGLEGAGMGWRVLK